MPHKTGGKYKSRPGHRRPDKNGGDKNKDKGKRGGRIARRAVRDVGIQQQPYLDAIAREIVDALDTYEESVRAANAAYGGFQREIRPFGPEFRETSADIQGDLVQRLAGFQDLLGQGQVGIPEEEQAAAAGLYGQLGGGALGVLAAQEARNLAYQTSAQREGALGERAARGNLLQDYNDLLEALTNRQLDIESQSPALIRQRQDELRQQALENRLVQSQLASDEAYSQFLMGQIGRALSQPPRRQDGRDGRDTTRTAGPPKEPRQPTITRPKFGGRLGAGLDTQVPLPRRVEQAVGPRIGGALEQFLGGTREFESFRPQAQRRISRRIESAGFRPKKTIRRLTKFYGHEVQPVRRKYGA